MTEAPSLAARLLLLAADRPPTDPAGRLGALRLLLLLHFTTETTISLLRWEAAGAAVLYSRLLALGAAGALALSFLPATRRFAAPVAALLLGSTLVRYFPNAANHTFLLFLALATVSLWDFRRREEQHLCLATLRWLTAIVLFSTGLQKLLHGTYFHGEFLAFQIAHGERFAELFRLLLDGEEIQRLHELGLRAATGAEGAPFRAYQTVPPAVGAGPYRLTSTMGLLLSNGVWVIEMAAPLLLLWNRTRRHATVAVVLFLAAIELGAHEILFGVLFVSLALVFFRRNWIRRFLPVAIPTYLYAIGVHLGWFPKWFFN